MAGGIWARVIMSVPSERDGAWAAEKSYLKKKKSNLKLNIFCFEYVETLSSFHCHIIVGMSVVMSSSLNYLGYLNIYASWIRVPSQEELCS